MSSPHVVVGGSVAAVVAADALARQGERVDLHLPPRVGGGFSAFACEGRRFEVGARLIELRYDVASAPPPSLDTYRPGPHGHRPFVSLVDELVRDIAGRDLIETEPALAYRKGAVGRDFVMTGDLRDLGVWLTAREMADVAREAADRVAIEGPHGVFAAGCEADLWGHTLSALSRRHCGDTFTDELMEPLARRMLHGGCESVIGGLHRKIWLPLFHPETIRQAATGCLRYVPDRPMHTLRNGGMGEIVDRLIRRVREAKTVTVHASGRLMRVAKSQGSTRLGFEDGTEIRARRPVLASEAAEMFAACGISVALERSMASLCWVDVDRAYLTLDPSLMMIVDAESPVYRVSRSLATRFGGVATFTCELDHARDPLDSAGELCAWLCRAGIVASPDHVRVVASLRTPAVVTPSFENAAAFHDARAQLDALALDVELAGPVCDFGVDSFNEQVVQGLRAAAAVGSA